MEARIITATAKQLESIGIHDIPTGTEIEIYDIDKYEHPIHGASSKIRYKYEGFDYIIPTSWTSNI